jgi:hypothetical protein
MTKFNVNPTFALAFNLYDKRGVLSGLRQIESLTGQQEPVYARPFVTTVIDNFQQVSEVDEDELPLEFDIVDGSALGWGRRQGDTLQVKRNSSWYNENGGTVLFFYKSDGNNYLAIYEVYLQPDGMLKLNNFLPSQATCEFAGYVPIALSDFQVEVLVNAGRELLEFPSINWNQTQSSPSLVRAEDSDPVISWNQLQTSPSLTRN